MRNPLSKAEVIQFERLLLEEWRNEYMKLLDSGILPDDMVQGHDHSAAKIAAYTAAQKFQPDDPKGREILQRYFGARESKSIGKTLIKWFKR